MALTYNMDGDTVKPDTINLARECAQLVRAKVSIIVATALDGAIGRNGYMPWNIPEDLKHFKTLTSGHPVIMGRKTWQSLPRRPLPGRRNIVVTRDRDFTADGAEVAHSIEDAISMCAAADEMFIIGGAQIYNQSLQYAGNLYLTAVLDIYPDADTFFPELNPTKWQMVWQSDVKETAEGLQYQSLNYVRI